MAGKKGGKGDKGGKGGKGKKSAEAAAEKGILVYGFGAILWIDFQFPEAEIIKRCKVVDQIYQVSRVVRTPEFSTGLPSIGCPVTG